VKGIIAGPVSGPGGDAFFDRVAGAGRPGMANGCGIDICLSPAVCRAAKPTRARIRV